MCEDWDRWTNWENDGKLAEVFLNLDIALAMSDADRLRCSEAAVIQRIKTLLKEEVEERVEHYFARIG